MLNIRKFAALLQTEGYFVSRFYIKAAKLAAIDAIISAFAYLFITLGRLCFSHSAVLPVFIAAAYLAALAGAVFSDIRAKLTFKYTARGKRLYISSALLILAFSLTFSINKYIGYNAVGLCFLSPFALIAAFFILLPFEKKNNARYVKKAAQALSNPEIIKIGITGSFGKTGVKSILNSFLSAKYQTLATKANFNTPLGISRAVNELKPDTEVFIAEMGARKKGDISELMDIVKPKIGILTGIAAQHIETFGSIDAIVKEKSRVLSMLPDGGVGIVGNGEYCRRICADVKSVNPTLRLITAGEGKDCEARVDNISCSEDGTSFSLTLPSGCVTIKTPLLGRHCALNIALAAAAADALFVPLAEIAARSSLLTPVPHRLQPMRTGGITVIDDSYNINPAGAAAALDTLALFKGRKIAALSGLVETGETWYKENYSLGRLVAECADIAVIIGKKNREPLIRGMLDEGLTKNFILFAEDTAASEKVYADNLITGDTLLLLCNIPPSYEL